MREIRAPRRPGPVPGSEVLPEIRGEQASGFPLPSGDRVTIEPVPPGVPRSTEDIYQETVAGLRQLGHAGAADALEREQLLLYGDPDAPEPVGIMGASAIAQAVQAVREITGS